VPVGDGNFYDHLLLWQNIHPFWDDLIVNEIMTTKIIMRFKTVLTTHLEYSNFSGAIAQAHARHSFYFQCFAVLSVMSLLCRQHFEIGQS
jgi:hypothetical protein